MSPKLTIVIPCYNMERWLPVALESCIAQTEQDIEVLAIDDGSTDGTLAIASAYASVDDRIRVLHHENKGAGLTRAVGQDEAKGEFLFWLDADDFLDKNAVKEMLAVAERDAVDMVCGNAVVFSDKTFNTRSYFPLPAVSKTTFENPSYWKSKVLWRWFFRTNFLRDINLSHPHYKLGQDVCSMYEALTKVASFSQCAYPFYYFRQDHKRPSSKLEVEVEHQIRHFQKVKATLLEAQRIKPLVKYINENLFRDIKKLAPRMTGADAVWRERCIEYCLELFDGLDPKWFRADFLAPELKEQSDFLPLVDAFITKDKQKITEQFDYWMAKGQQKRAPNKESAFHTLRRHIKAALSPRSIKTRLLLRGYERDARIRLKHLGVNI